MNQNESVHILMVDDLEPNHLLMKKYIAPFGYQLDHCYDGRECIHLLQHSQYDLIFTDIHMPQIDGIQMTHYLRIEMDIITPIILLFGTADLEEKDIALGIGMDGFITKPIHKEQVKTILEHYFTPQRSV